MSQWSVSDMPDQGGRTVVVTGASAGLGLETTRQLAARGAHVVMACRNGEKAERARASLGPLRGSTEVAQLDLADLGQVRAFARSMAGRRIDVLVNNAGLMVVPLARTAHGHESQFGVNVLGHFLLTGLLLPQVHDRVVTLASHAHWAGRINLDDPDFRRRRYDAWTAYAQSKLADLVFAVELQRRLVVARSLVRSMAAHPGYTATSTPSTERLLDRLNAVATRAFAQQTATGALPELYAATVADLPGGSYVGPGERFQLGGAPRVVSPSRAALDPGLGRSLWELCERLTGQPFEVRAP